MSGASILFIGTQEHQKALLPKMNSLEVFTTFCMTELCHGSNSQGIETIAMYKQDTDEFEIYTPSDNAQKTWAVNGLNHANYAIVFANLYVNAQNHGVHALAVPIRNEKDHTLLPQVTIRDMGHKIGLNGVDCARLWFNHLRVPRKCLLNRLADIDPVSKDYSSVLKQKSATVRELFFSKKKIILIF